MVDSTQFKYRSVQVPHASSLFPNNLSTDGKSFVTVKNTEQGGQIAIYAPNLIEKSNDTVAPISSLT
jgi:hypothetical protein